MILNRMHTCAFRIALQPSGFIPQSDFSQERLQIVFILCSKLPTPISGFPAEAQKENR
jgi:hypothetical protein